MRDHRTPSPFSFIRESLVFCSVIVRNDRSRCKSKSRMTETREPAIVSGPERAGLSLEDNRIACALV
jgi:hypothetical protein